MVIGMIQCLSVIFKGPVSVDSGILLSAGCLSFFLGLGLIKQHVLAVRALLFFASGVAFSKFLILAGVFTLPPASQILLPKTLENGISILYHLVLVFFLLKHVKIND